MTRSFFFFSFFFPFSALTVSFSGSQLCSRSTQMHKRFLVYAISPLLYNMVLSGITLCFAIWKFAIDRRSRSRYLSTQLSRSFHFPSGSHFLDGGFKINWEVDHERRQIFRARSHSLEPVASFFLVALASAWRRILFRVF